MESRDEASPCVSRTGTGRILRIPFFFGKADAARAVINLLYVLKALEGGIKIWGEFPKTRHKVSGKEADG